MLKAIQAALRAISGASYNYPVAAPASVSLDPTMNMLTATGVDLPLYVVEPDPNGRRDFHPAMQVVDFFRGTITARMDAVESAVNPLARAIVWEGLASDIEKALAVDVTLGGLVYDIRLLTPQPLVAVGSEIVVLVQPFEARLHRTYGAP